MASRYEGQAIAFALLIELAMAEEPPRMTLVSQRQC
jgi:hypothetical protein